MIFSLIKSELKAHPYLLKIMNYSTFSKANEATGQFVRTQVVRLDSQKGLIWVRSHCGSASLVACQVLAGPRTKDGEIHVGDTVLMWLPESADQFGVVLGRIEPFTDSKSRADQSEELILTAEKNLTLKCGDGSITIRNDGKILIKGKDLVSQAQCTNRIKGGAVSIN